LESDNRTMVFNCFTFTGLFFSEDYSMFGEVSEAGYSTGLSGTTFNSVKALTGSLRIFNMMMMMMMVLIIIITII